MRLPVNVWRLGALLLLGCLLAMTAFAADDWALLWQNQFSEAKTAYQETLRQSPRDAAALLGMATVTTWEDDQRQAVGYWQRYLQVAPGSWQAMAYWPTLVSLAQQTGEWEALDQAAHAILAAPNAAVQMRASARLVLAQSAQRQQQFASAEATWSHMGYLSSWMVIGPFDNISHGGYAKAYPPETELDFSKTYTGSGNLPLHWYPIGPVARNGRCTCAWMPPGRISFSSMASA